MALAAVLTKRYDTYFANREAISFEVKDLDGTTTQLGPDSPVFTVQVTSAKGAQALASMDQFAIGVAYLQGGLDFQGDLMTALKMRGMFHDRHPIAWIARFIKADRPSISSHYDNDSDFFLTFMDKRHRCYTQGVFERDDELLEDAMTRKMDIALEAINAKPGDHVLEVGGGWGAFMEHAGKRGIRVTALTLAEESERYLNDLIAREGLPAKVIRQHALEYKSAERYDAVVNMGVTEHIPDYKTSLKQYAAWLKPGGRVYLDALAMRTKHNVSTFMSRYIYPGKSSPLVLHQYLKHVAHSPFQLISVEDDRHNYHLTCAEWARRLDAARDDIVKRWGDPFYRRFRLFLWGSAASFDTGMVEAYRWVLKLP
jgi:cyclopropane-fatty-acyl-phospholipid synthase